MPTICEEVITQSAGFPHNCRMLKAVEHLHAARTGDLRRERTVPARVVAARLALAIALGAALAWVALDVAAGRSAFLSGGVVALASALVVPLGIGPMALRLAPFAPSSLDVRRNLVLVSLPGSSFLLFAVEERWHPLGLPAAGDVALAGQALAVAAGVFLTAQGRSGTRAVRPALDGVVMGCAVLMAMWATVLGPRLGFHLTGPGDGIGLVLVLLVLVKTSMIGLVLLRDVTTRPASAFLTMLLVGFAEVRIVQAGLGGGVRTTDALTMAAWCGGWVLFLYSVFNTRTAPASVVDEARLRGAEALATVLVTVSCLVCGGVALLVPRVGQFDLARAGSPAAVLGIVTVLVLAVREAFLARARIRLDEQLHRQATLDRLTGLANRDGLTTALDRLVGRDEEWVLLTLDLDGFKAVNDVHGNAAGDQVLRAVAQVLQEQCPAGGLSARTGGDEFTVLAPGTLRSGQLLAHRIRVAVTRRLDGLELGPRITVSVGIGTVLGSAAPPRDGLSHDRLSVVTEAAAALRSAKSAGRNRVEVYPGPVARAHERKLLVENRLREALADGGIGTVGQPIVDLRSGEPVAYEALARWDDPVLGPVPAQEFVAVAEQTGLIGDLGRRVLRSALEGFLERGLLDGGRRLAVNASPLELRHPGYVAGVVSVLQEYRFPPQHLIVEVTEAIAIDEVDPTVNVLHRLVGTGVRVAVDDFGTGYSALGYLRRLPLQSLKVDRTLLAEGRTAARTRNILVGVVDLARRLDLPVTVEGIEDQAGVALALDLGADAAQGYLLGRPVAWRDPGLVVARTVPSAGATA